MSRERDGGTAQRDATAEQFERAGEMYERLDRTLATLDPPRPFTSLLDLAAMLGCAPGDLVLDAGAYASAWGRRLAERFGCRAVAADLVHHALVDARAAGVPGVRADLAFLPVRSGAFDLVWCRDVLSCVHDPDTVLAALAGVLRPGGGMVLYLAVPTDDLELREGERLMRALELPEWWRHGRTRVDAAIGAAGLEVVHVEPVSPHYAEHDLLAGGGEAIHALTSISRIRRGRAQVEAAVGEEWTERILGWSHWSVYLVLGKLQTWAWALRRPG